MIDLGPASEEEVVLAWLRAEIDATRYGALYAAALCEMRGTREALIDAGDVRIESQNHERAHLLGCVRGYRRDAYLFSRFPNDVSWRRCEVLLHELSAFTYANFPDLLALSGESRRVSQGARTVTNAMQGSGVITPDIERIWAVKERFESGHVFPELVAVRDSELLQIVLIEGHTRATAYVAATRPPHSVPVFLGTSPQMRNWRFFLDTWPPAA